MKNLIIKIFTAVCFVSSLLIMGIGVEQCSILISAVGLGIFSLLIPLSKTDAFEEKNIKKEGR